MAKTPTWQRAEGKNPNGGLNEKGRASLKAAGHDIKRPQPEGGSRKDSFCARMKGMKSKLTSAETANDPNSRINKSLRAWKCRADGGEVEGDVQFAEDDPYAKVQEAAKLPMMAQNDFAMRMPQQEVKYDTGPQAGEATLKGYEPTVREQIAQKMMGDERPSPERQQFVQGMMGTTGIGQRGMGVADFVPVAGQALQAQESYQQRDPKGFLLATIPVPGANIEGKIAQGAAAAAERAMAGQAAQQMTKSESQAAMKAAWEAGQGNTEQYKNWNHQWNVEHGPQYAVQQAIQAAPPPAAVPTFDPNYQRVTNPVGFYSLGHEVASTQLPDTIRTWQEMQSLLKKGGVKDEEMQFAGLSSMDPMEKISRQQIADAFKNNFPQVEEVWKLKNSGMSQDDIARIAQFQNNRHLAQQDLDAANNAMWEASGRGNPGDQNIIVAGSRMPYSMNELREALRHGSFDVGNLPEHMRGPALNFQDAILQHDNAEAQYLEAIQANRRQSHSDPKWERYTHPGGTDYSESILRLPYNNPSSFREIHPDVAAKYADQHAALQERVFNLKESLDAQRSADYKAFTDARDALRTRYQQKVTEDALAEGADPEFAMRHGYAFAAKTPYNNMSQYLGEEPLRESKFISAQQKQLDDQLYAARGEAGALTNKQLAESRALANIPGYTEQHFTHESHLGDIDNPLLHQRWKERVGPEGERILSNEEFQSDLGQEGADRGFRDPNVERQHKQFEERKADYQNRMKSEYQKLADEYNQAVEPLQQQRKAEQQQFYDEFDKSNKLRSDVEKLNAAVAPSDEKYREAVKPFQAAFQGKQAELVERFKPEWEQLNAVEKALPSMVEDGVPLFPHVGTTDKWVELGAKHALQHALENGHDKIFVMGGQEQARRWQSGLRQAVENIRWESPNAEEVVSRNKAIMQQIADERDRFAQTVFEVPYHQLPARSMGDIDRMIRQAGKMPTDMPQSVNPNAARVVYAKPVNGMNDARFVVDKDGKIIESSMGDATGKKLKDAVGGDLAKRIMGEEVGNIPMDSYIMGAEGYTHHYEKKVPSIYKDIIEKHLKVKPRVEAGPLVERGTQNSAEIPPWGQLERQGEGQWRVNFSDGSFRGGYGREAAEEIVNRARQRFEASGRTWEPGVVEPLQGPHGTYIHITPEMREAYQRIKKERGSVFPGYKRGGMVRSAYADGGEVIGDKVDPYDAVQQAASTEKQYKPFDVLPLREDASGIHFDSNAGVMGGMKRAGQYFYDTMSGRKEMDPTSPEAIEAASNIAGMTTLGAGAFDRPAGAIAAGASRPEGMFARTGADLMAKDPYLAANPPTLIGRGNYKNKPFSEFSIEGQNIPGYLSEWKPRTIEEMQGHWVAPLLSDLSATGTRIHKIGENELSEDLLTYGGGDYPRGPSGRGQNPAAWAATKPGASGYQNKMNKVVPEGERIFGLQSAMGHTAADSSNMMVDAILHQMPAAKTAKKDIELFDEKMRKRLPDWPGVKAKNVKEYLMKLPFTKRSLLAQEMDKAGFANTGFPNVPETRFAISEPRLLSAPHLGTGYSIAELNPRAKAVVDVEHPHPNYPGTMPSPNANAYYGGFTSPVHASTVWKDWWNNLAPIAREYKNRPMAQRGLLTQFPIERVDQAMVDRVMAEQEAHKRRFGWQKGGRINRRPFDDGGAVFNSTAPQNDVYDDVQNAANVEQPKKEYQPFNVLPFREDDSGIHFDSNAGAIGGLKRAGQYFYDTMSGQKQMDPTSPEAIESATNIAGVVGGGGRLVGRAPEGAIGMFAGRRSLTADQAAHDVAQSMLGNGPSVDHIYSKTGWFPGADGNLRYRISDVNSNLTDKYYQEIDKNGAVSGVLADYFNHGDLYKAYPDFKNKEINIINRPNAEIGGKFNKDTGNIEISTNKSGDHDEGVRALILHELQHAIQEKEGFSPGGDGSFGPRYPYLMGENEARKAQFSRNISNDDTIKSPGLRPWKPEPAPNGLDDVYKVHPYRDQVDPKFRR